MEDLRVGVIGYGLRGPLARHAHQPGRGSAVVAVGDPRPERRELAGADFGPDVLLTDDPGEVLRAGLDAVFVLSPDHLHAEHALAAFDAGVPVYLEKPLAITLEECDALLGRAREAGVKLYIGHNMRHMPVVQTMRQLILDGAIGEVKAVWCRHFVGHGGDYYFKDWHAERAKGTGLLLQKAAHDIDVIHWLAGGYTRRVNAMGALTLYDRVTDRAPAAPFSEYKASHELETWPPLAQTGLNPVIDVEDLSMVNMALDNGVLATYEQCHYTPDYWRNYTVIGTEGRLENIGDTSDATVHVWNRRHRGHAPADVVVPVASAEGGHGGADPGIVAEFLRFVREGGETLTSPVAAREAVATGCAATDSLRSGGVPIDIPAVPADLRGYFAAGQAG
ncbi:putative dehydrogenase [Saccharothrix tamanrassetensis]|uniref:Putative dehydrogenase n=1 Tax=Saccharothrix tamanrassetensis TaxID=1051531 RepID=A0A841CIC7_9PSEU|nr:Gfo/Idh/MocA family oxidoreductase [Saccharothrix tamanrassetensis]MBB5957049.1 putative dehydrogenase [Saccharothrix tamanrassetensis]